MSATTGRPVPDDAALWSVVVPTLGRPSLAVLLASLACQQHHPADVVVVDDRRYVTGPLDVAAHPQARLLAGEGRGPAAARNLGWRAVPVTGSVAAGWVVFLDDDVVLPLDWSGKLLADLRDADLREPGEARPGAVSGRIVVPLPDGRRPTDWERCTAGLEHARWATADMAVRRSSLVAVGGFDERFRRAYREDADLAARLTASGVTLRTGHRHVVHPVRPADDELMRALHGPGWRERAWCPPGRFRWHAATVAAGVLALGCLALRQRRLAATVATMGACLTADFAARRIAPGPRTGSEIATLLATSAAIPPAAVWWRAVGWLRYRHVTAWSPSPPVRAVLLDRDGTLVHDVPYNANPESVTPVGGAVEALARLRAAGLLLGVVSNQSGIGRGLLTEGDVERVNARIEAVLGPFGTWQSCPHLPEDGCSCRKPAPGMVTAAALALGVEPAECVVIGDIGADVEAARAAGARAVLVPTPATCPQEIATAEVVASSLSAAVDLVLRGAVTPLAPSPAVSGKPGAVPC
jgi:histidinol-phosphate phosphatase family protein